MFRWIGITLYLSVILLGASLCFIEPGERGDPSCVLSKALREELSGGEIGGAGLEALAESLSRGEPCGVWESAVFDPDERCWYLTGWIDDERIGSRRMSLTLSPILNGVGARAWHFFLLCSSRFPGEPEQIELEGAWRDAGDQTRIAWLEMRNGVAAPDGPFVRVFKSSRSLKRQMMVVRKR